MSVAEVAPWAWPIRAAPWLSVIIDAIAAAAAAGLATPFLIAWPITPVPSGFDSTRT